MSGFGDGTGWSSERGETPGYTGSSGNAGNNNGGGNGSGSVLGGYRGVPIQVGNSMAIRGGVSPSWFSTYVLTTEGSVLGITVPGIDLGDAYGVNLGYPEPGDYFPGNSSAPGGYLPYNLDTTVEHVRQLNHIVSGNASSKQKEDAKVELAIIADINKKKPSDFDITVAVRATTDFYQTVFNKFGDNAKQLALDFAELSKGKRIKNASEALQAFEKYRGSISNKFGPADRAAIANALRSLDYNTLSVNLKNYGRALGFYGTVYDVIDVVNEIIRALETNRWQPVFVKLERITAGKVATAAVALAFGIITGTTLGIIGYAVVLALVGALVNDALISRINYALKINTQLGN